MEVGSKWWMCFKRGNTIIFQLTVSKYMHLENPCSILLYTHDIVCCSYKCWTMQEARGRPINLQVNS